MDKRPTNEEHAELIQVERNRQEFTVLLQLLEKNDPDGFPALYAKAKAILTGEATVYG